MAPIKAIIHEATFTLRAATDGALTVVVIVGAGVAKRRIKKKSGQEQLRLLCYAIVVFHCDRELSEHQVSSYSALITHDSKAFIWAKRFLPFFLFV